MKTETIKNLINQIKWRDEDISSKLKSYKNVDEYEEAVIKSNKETEILQHVKKELTYFQEQVRKQVVPTDPNNNERQLVVAVDGCLQCTLKIVTTLENNSELGLEQKYHLHTNLYHSITEFLLIKSSLELINVRPYGQEDSFTMETTVQAVAQIFKEQLQRIKTIKTSLQPSPESAHQVTSETTQSNNNNDNQSNNNNNAHSKRIQPDSPIMSSHPIKKAKKQQEEYVSDDEELRLSNSEEDSNSDLNSGYFSP